MAERIPYRPRRCLVRVRNGFTEMATEDSRSDFLRFSAYSMKDLITRKLSQNSRFTDQIYEGSNLAILIDLVSYMYQCLVYQLNSAASESMFADT